MSRMEDMATDLEMATREAAIEHHFSRPRPTGASRLNCLDCDCEIPLERRQAVAGCRRCIGCERLAERHARP